MKIKVSLLHTYIYQKFIKATKGFWKKVYVIVKDVFVKDKNIFVSTVINGFKCVVPYTWLTPLFMNVNPHYDRQLNKICQFLKSQYNHNLNIIDVGANIGDTVLNIGDIENKYLLIEGVETYCSLISNNLKHFDYILEQMFVGDGSESTVQKKVVLDHGTGRISCEKASTFIEFITIDFIVEKYQFFPDILKIDTDGYDFAVLRGANRMLTQAQPLVFFEWSLDELIENGENPISIFGLLRETGYDELILFDNYGNLFNICKTRDTDYLKRCIEYTWNKTIYYYDVCAINRNMPFRAQDLWNWLK